MKKIFNIFLVVCIVLTLASCTNDDIGTQPVIETAAPTQTENITPAVTPTESPTQKPTPDILETELFEGKIGIISLDKYSDHESYIAAQRIVKEYGEDKVIHLTWPSNYSEERELTSNMVASLGADPDIKAIIVNPVIYGNNDAFGKLKETRKDILVIYIDAWFGEIPQKKIMTLAIDELGMGSAMVRQAHKLGAKTFVHYSFPRHMGRVLYSARHDLIRETCAELGMEFVDATIPDPNGNGGMAPAEQFVFDDISKMVAKYGKDTAFFCTYDIINNALVKAVVDTGAIYPQPVYSSPYVEIVDGLELKWYSDRITNSFKDIPAKDVIAHEREALAEKNMLGRISAWPDLFSMVATPACADYAIKWINGEVPKEGIDAEVLNQLLEEYAGAEVYLTPFVDDGIYSNSSPGGEPSGKTYENFFMMRMDYITY